MRFLSCWLLVLLAAVPTWAQQQETTVTSQEKPQDKPAQPAPLNLPVSLDKIREGLSQPAPAEPLKGLGPGEQPTFRVTISEQQKFEQMLSKIKWDPPGPQVAGGIYAYEQQERMFPRINNPRVQPYSAFTTGEVATLAVEALIEKYVAEKMKNVVGTALREQAEREARDEVARSLAAYWASQTPPPPAAPQPKE
jgi:hypothetical protein